MNAHYALERYGKLEINNNNNYNNNNNNNRSLDRYSRAQRYIELEYFADTENVRVSEISIFKCETVMRARVVATAKTVRKKNSSLIQS